MRLITIAGKANQTENNATVLRSAMIRSVGQRDIGLGESSKFFFSGNHCSFKFVCASVDLSTVEVVRGKNGDLSSKKNLIQIFANRHNIRKEYPIFDLEKVNFLEFARHFFFVKGPLKLHQDPEYVIVITVPHEKKEEHGPKYVSFCRYSFIK